MTLLRLLPRDEDGRPRTLRGHGEALRWSASTVARPMFSRRSVGYVGGGVFVASLVRYATDDESPGPVSLLSFAAVLAGAAILLWLVGTVLLYLYAILQGGVER